MKQYALYDSEIKSYYNFASKRWSSYLTLGCLVTKERQIKTMLDKKTIKLQVIAVSTEHIDSNSVIDTILV